MGKHIFGPVPSRRLGISLGIDIIPYKTCTLDCVYCECGPTTRLTVERQGFVEPGIVTEELEILLEKGHHVDYITFSGSGEPTLNRYLGQLIARIKKMTPIPVAVLTNGTLLHLPEVREELMPADVVLPSLDAVSPETFRRINRPHQDLDIREIITGLVEFGKTYRGQVWMEVLIVKGINDDRRELDRLHEALKQIAPRRVQLNSLDRPPALEGTEAVDMETLERIAAGWRDLPVEIVKRTESRREIAVFSRNLENNILNIISRRPLTVDDLVALTGKNRLEIFKYIDILEKEKKIRPRIVGKHIFYAPVSK